MIGLLAKGGLLLIPIFACSVVGLAIFLERLIRLYQTRLKDPLLPEQIYAAVVRGDLEKAQALAAKEESSTARVLREGLSVCCADRETLETVLSHAIEREVRRLCRYFGSLALIGNVTPLLGLLGTVIGMIKAFMAIERLGGKVNAAVLAGGIWEAMLTTAVGLSVAIPVIMAYSYLNGRVDQRQAEMEEAAITLLKAVREQNRA